MLPKFKLCFLKMQTFKVKYQEISTNFWLMDTMYWMQVCINSSFDCDGCAGSEIFLLGLQVGYVNTFMQHGRYQHRDTQFSFIQILFHKIESYASVGRYSFSTMVIIQGIQTVCMSTLIYPSFHQNLIMLLCNSSFTTKASC